MEHIKTATSLGLLTADPTHWVGALFLYLTVVDQNRRRNPKLVGTWLWELALLTTMGFGGGIINPVLLGMDGYFPFPMGSDVVIPTIFVAYIAVGAFGPVLETPGVSHCRLAAFELVRAKLICAWASKAAVSVAPTDWAQAPVFAPLICGVIGGCGGLFLANGGLSPIQNEIPWSVESALTASALHFVFSNGLVTLPPAVSDAIAADAKSIPQIVVMVFLLTMRLVPSMQAFLPWRVVGRATSASVTGAGKDTKKSKADKKHSE